MFYTIFICDKKRTLYRLFDVHSQIMLENMIIRICTNVMHSWAGIIQAKRNINMPKFWNIFFLHFQFNSYFIVLLF